METASFKYILFYHHLQNIIRDFGFAKLTWHSVIKRKSVFLLYLFRFFVTLPYHSCF